MTAAPLPLVEQFQYGLDAPICLTWELSYACNLACVHCLSSSGRRDPRELSTAECKALIDEFERMQIFYVNIGGGEPTVRADFWELVDYATAHHVGREVLHQRRAASTPRRRGGWLPVTTWTCRSRWTARPPRSTTRSAAPGSYATALRAMQHLAGAGFRGFKISVVMTRHNVGQLDEFKALADRFDAQLRITRLRPSGRGADSWDELHVTAAQQRQLYDWLVAHGEGVLTGDSFFHLAGYGDAPPGLNLCGAGRVVCLVDPVGDVYACPFAIHENFLAGNVRAPGGFAGVWRESELFADLRRPQSGGACTSCSAFDACRGGCMAAKFFTGLPLDGPDPECVKGHGTTALALVDRAAAPRPALDHSHRTSLRLTPRRPPERACDENPLAGLRRALMQLADLTSPDVEPCSPTAAPCLPCRSARPSSTARTCRCRPTLTWPSRCASSSRCAARCWSRRPSPTARAVSTPASPARCRSARRRLSCWWSSCAAPPPTPSRGCCW